MKPFEEIENMYNASEVASQDGWQVYQVAWPELKRYHHLLKGLEASLREHDLLEEWSGFLAFYKRFQFFLSTTPLSPSALLKAMLGWKGTHSHNLALLKGVSPEPVTRWVDEIIKSCGRLQAHADSPLWTVATNDLLARHAEGATIAVLYSENRLGGLLEGLLASFDADHIDFYPVRATDLKDPWIYDQLMVFGPTKRRFDDGTGFVFKSPRANLLTLFVPDWFRADIPTPYDLAGSPHRLSSHQNCVGSRSFNTPTVFQSNPFEENAANGDLMRALTDGDESKTDDGWLDIMPLPKVKYRPFNDREAQDGEITETIAAKQVFLSADHVVYLPIDGSVYRLVDHLDPDSGVRVCQSVDHIEVDEVGPGEILLFSEEGGGRMVFDVANDILGGEAERLRSIQKSWKDTYFKKTIFNSDVEIIRDLKGLGAKSVTLGMIHNWRSRWNIGPGSWVNFEALLGYCDLLERKDEIFQATSRIRSAHIQAGSQLTRRLLELMQRQSLDQLHAEGRQVFGGTPKVPTQKVAFFVLGVAPEGINVSPNDIAEPVPIQEGSWL